MSSVPLLEVKIKNRLPQSLESPPVVSSRHLRRKSLQVSFIWKQANQSLASHYLEEEPIKVLLQFLVSLSKLRTSTKLLRVLPCSLSSAFLLRGSLRSRSDQAPCSPFLSLPSSLTSTRVLSFLIQEQNQSLRPSEIFLILV